MRVVVEEPLDEVDVGHEHAAAAVALQAQRVEGVAVMFLLLRLMKSERERRLFAFKPSSFGQFDPALLFFFSYLSLYSACRSSR